MIRASRILIIGLLVLTQFFAPLVHAHAGGGDSPGVMHVPGLEFLTTQGGVYVQDRGDRLSPEVIVALSPGLKGIADLAVPSSDPQLPALPTPAVRFDSRPSGLPRWALQPRAPFPDRIFTSAHPRAPPA